VNGLTSFLYQFLVGGLIYFSGWTLVELASYRRHGRGIPTRWRLLLAILFLFYFLLQGIPTWG
jgi:hypothetical protein